MFWIKPCTSKVIGIFYDSSFRLEEKYRDHKYSRKIGMSFKFNFFENSESVTEKSDILSEESEDVRRPFKDNGIKMTNSTECLH